MSQAALRYTNPTKLFKVPDLDKKSKHHVPPRNPAKFTPFLLKKSIKDHRAYHQLFRNAASFEQCCEILHREWWTKPAQGDRNV